MTWVARITSVAGLSVGFARVVGFFWEGARSGVGRSLMIVVPVAPVDLDQHRRHPLGCPDRGDPDVGQDPPARPSLRGRPLLRELDADLPGPRAPGREPRRRGAGGAVRLFRLREHGRAGRRVQEPPARRAVRADHADRDRDRDLHAGAARRDRPHPQPRSLGHAARRRRPRDHGPDRRLDPDDRRRAVGAGNQQQHDPRGAALPLRAGADGPAAARPGEDSPALPHAVRRDPDADPDRAAAGAVGNVSRSSSSSR